MTAFGTLVGKTKLWRLLFLSDLEELNQNSTTLYEFPFSDFK